MPYHSQWDKNGIVWKFYGYVTAEEIEDANGEFYENERSDVAKYQIIDALEVTDVEWNDIDIKEIAAMDKGASLLVNQLYVAYVSVNEKVTSKLEKYIEISRILNSSWKFKGFSTLDSALKLARQTKTEEKKEES